MPAKPLIQSYPSFPLDQELIEIGMTQDRGSMNAGKNCPNPKKYMFTKAAYSLLKNRLKRPLFLILFVTNLCNARCKHCFNHEEMDKSTPPLSLDELESVSQSLGGLLEVALSGGEPFLRDDLFDLFKIFVENNKARTFVIPTNGILTEKIGAGVSTMLSYGKVKDFTIVLSLDGPKDMHNQIRGFPCFDKVFNTYEKLVALKETYPQLHLRINTVITDKNHTQIPRLHEWLKKNMTGIDVHDLEIVRGDPREGSYGPPTTEILRGLKPVLLKIWRHYLKGGILTESKIDYNLRKTLYENYIEILETDKQPWPCLAGTLHCVIDYQGDVSFCEPLPKIGNLRENTFDEIWHSRKAEEQRASIRARSCTCTHSCFQTTNLAFNQFRWPRLMF